MRGLVVVGGGDRQVVLTAVDPGDPGEHLLRGSLGIHDQAAVLLVDGCHELEPGVEAEQLPAAGFPAGPGDIQAAACGQAEQRQFGGITGRFPAGTVQVRVVASCHALGEQAEPVRTAVGRRDGGWRGQGRVGRHADLTFGGPDGGDVHPVLCEGAGLVGADDGGGAEGLYRTEPLDEGSAAGHLADAEGEGDGGQQSLRDVGDQQPDCKTGGRGYAQPGGQADGQECDPGPDGDEADQHRGPFDLG
jgi:hypothetical protein